MVRGWKVIRKLRHLFQATIILSIWNAYALMANGAQGQKLCSVYMHSRVGHPRFPNTGLDTFHNSDKIKITDSRVYSHVFIKKVSNKKIQISLIWNLSRVFRVHGRATYHMAHISAITSLSATIFWDRHRASFPWKSKTRKNLDFPRKTRPVTVLRFGFFFRWLTDMG